MTTAYLTYLALEWRTPKTNALHATDELLKYFSGQDSMETKFSMQKTVLIDQLNKRMFRDGASFSLIAVATATLYRLFFPRHEQAIQLLNSTQDLNKFYTYVVALANNENEISAIVDERLKQMKIYF